MINLSSGAVSSLGHDTWWLNTRFELSPSSIAGRSPYLIP